MLTVLFLAALIVVYLVYGIFTGTGLDSCCRK